MALVTGRSLCGAALSEIGVTSGGEAASSDDAAFALATLNRMLDQMKAERLQIPNIVRTTFPITANKGEYHFGSLTSATAITGTVTDGFEGTWTASDPPNWVVSETNGGAVTRDTVTYYSGGVAMKLAGGPSGTVTVYRDFPVRSGAAVRISLWGESPTSSGDVRIYNPDTAMFLTSAGAWQAASANVFTITGSAFAESTIAFDMEAASTVGDPNTTVRLIVFTDDNASTWVDSVTVEWLATEAIPISKPRSIDHVNLLDTSQSPDHETPLTPYTDDGWATVPQKNQTSTQPTHYYYNPSHPNGSLSLHPVPTGSSLKLAIYVPTPLDTFASLSTEVALPEGYEEMLVTNLAVRLCPSFQRQASPELVMAAREAKAIVKRSNQRISDLSFDPGALIGGGGWFDIRTGR